MLARANYQEFARLKAAVNSSTKIAGRNTQHLTIKAYNFPEFVWYITVFFTFNFSFLP